MQLVCRRLHAAEFSTFCLVSHDPCVPEFGLRGTRQMAILMLSVLNPTETCSSKEREARLLLGTCGYMCLRCVSDLLCITSWGPPGPHSGLLVASWGLLGRLGSVLGTSWGRLGTSWGPPAPAARRRSARKRNETRSTNPKPPAFSFGRLTLQ